MVPVSVSWTASLIRIGKEKPIRLNFLWQSLSALSALRTSTRCFLAQEVCDPIRMVLFTFTADTLANSPLGSDVGRVEGFWEL